jgi:hypothetical protein
MTPTQVCSPDCCFVELCFGDDCTSSCTCNEIRAVYLSICKDARCELANATGIFENADCTTPAQTGAYTDGTNNCYYWDGSSLVLIGPC